MGEEATIFGSITGATAQRLQARNAEIINGLPIDDDWPFLSGDAFALPPPRPRGTYECQVIHFGMSLKSEHDGPMWAQWLGKLEAVLRKLYWFSACAVISEELGATRVYRWTASERACDGMLADLSQPVDEWTRTVCGLPDGAA